MPIPLIFPIAGLVVSGTGVAMIVTYIQSDQATRSRLDQWLTDAAAFVVKAYLKLRYGVDLGSFTAEEEKEYWKRFGIAVEAFLAIAEPKSMELYGKSFVHLAPEEQAIVARKVARETEAPEE